MSSPPYFHDRYSKSSGNPRKFFVVVLRKLLKILSTCLYCLRERLVSLPVYLSLAYVEQITVSSLVVSDARVCVTVLHWSLAVSTRVCRAVFPDMQASYATPR